MSWTIEQQRKANRDSYYKHKEERLKQTKEYHKKLKEEVLSHYSKGKLKCACCGETIPEFLGLDHISGGGSAHRREVGSSYRYYLWLKRHNYPKGYRVLCHNCNLATSWGRVCPHKRKELKEEI